MSWGVFKVFGFVCKILSVTIHDKRIFRNVLKCYLICLCSWIDYWNYFIFAHLLRRLVFHCYSTVHLIEIINFELFVCSHIKSSIDITMICLICFFFWFFSFFQIAFIKYAHFYISFFFIGDHGAINFSALILKIEISKMWQKKFKLFVFENLKKLKNRFDFEKMMRKKTTDVFTQQGLKVQKSHDLNLISKCVICCENNFDYLFYSLRKKIDQICAIFFLIIKISRKTQISIQKTRQFEKIHRQKK